MTLQEYKEISKINNLDDLSKVSNRQMDMYLAIRIISKVFNISELKAIDICNTIYLKLRKEYRDTINRVDILEEFLKSVKINYTITNDVLEEYEKLLVDSDAQIKHLSINFNGLAINLMYYIKRLEDVTIPKLSELIEGSIKDYITTMSDLDLKEVVHYPRVINASFEFIN